jgi:hypothetical protein
LSSNSATLLGGKDCRTPAYRLASKNIAVELRPVEVEAGTFDQAIVPASQLLPQFPNATVDALTVTQIRQGKDFRLSPLSTARGPSA